MAPFAGLHGGATVKRPNRRSTPLVLLEPDASIITNCGLRIEDRVEPVGAELPVFFSSDRARPAPLVRAAWKGRRGPAGAIAQVMGHKPSATAEGYRPRGVDALRPFLASVEKHILDKAGIEFDADAEPGKLHVVAG